MTSGKAFERMWPEMKIYEARVTHSIFSRSFFWQSSDCSGEPHGPLANVPLSWQSPPQDSNAEPMRLAIQRTANKRLSAFTKKFPFRKGVNTVVYRVLASSWTIGRSRRHVVQRFSFLIEHWRNWWHLNGICKLIIFAAIACT